MYVLKCGSKCKIIIYSKHSWLGIDIEPLNFILLHIKLKFQINFQIKEGSDIWGEK